MLLFMYLPAEGSSFQSHRVCSGRIAHRLPIPVGGRGFISLPYLSIWALRPLLWYVVRSIRRVFLRKFEGCMAVRTPVRACLWTLHHRQRNSNWPWTPCASYTVILLLLPPCAPFNSSNLASQFPWYLSITNFADWSAEFGYYHF